MGFRGCCSNNDKECYDSDPEMQAECQLKLSKFPWHPTKSYAQQVKYVSRLERQYETLKSSYFKLSSEVARLQFRVRQLIQDTPSNPAELISEVECIVFQEINGPCRSHAVDLASLKNDKQDMDDFNTKQRIFITNVYAHIGSFQNSVNFLKQAEEKKQEANDQENDPEYICCSLSKKASESKSRKSAGSELVMDSNRLHINTSSFENADQSASVKELRDMYQKGISVKIE